MNNVPGQAARKAHKAQHCWPPCRYRFDLVQFVTLLKQDVLRGCRLAWTGGSETWVPTVSLDVIRKCSRLFWYIGTKVSVVKWKKKKFLMKYANSLWRINLSIPHMDSFNLFGAAGASSEYSSYVYNFVFLCLFLVFLLYMLQINARRTIKSFSETN